MMTDLSLEIEDLENELSSAPLPDYDDLERLKELKRECIYQEARLEYLRQLSTLQE